MNFDRIAPYFGALEAIAFQSAMQRARVSFVESMAQHRHVLILGDGDGKLSRAILARDSKTMVRVIEASEAMTLRAKQRLEKSGTWPERLIWTCADLRDVELEASSFDAIATPFVLDCFQRDGLRDVIGQLAAAATVDASWYLADFAPVQGRAGPSLRRGLWHAMLYRFFAWTAAIEARELTDPTPFLVDAQFNRVESLDFRAGLLVAEHWRRALPDAPDRR